jgi:two-component sensor histidine kinase
LGPREGWPVALATLTEVILASEQAMFVAWGPERTLIYNDAYAEILADKHPGAMGRPLLEVWREIEDDLAPIVERAYAGEPIHMDDIPFVMWRRGYPEQTHFAFSYTPVRGEDGEVAGFFCPCRETTLQVQAEKRARVRARLGEALRGVEDGRAVRVAVAEALTVYFHPARLVRMRVLDGEVRMARDWPDTTDEPPSARLADPRLRDAIEGRAAVTAAGLGSDDEAGRAFVRALEAPAGMLVPLPEQAGPYALALGAMTARSWTEKDADFARELTERGWTEFKRLEAQEALAASEAQLRLVNQELKHRAKNLFAVVHSLVSMTARSAAGGDAGEVVAKIGDRLGALAAAHAVGTDGSAGGSSLEALLRSLLAPYPQAEDRLAVEGPVLPLPNEAVTPLALALHELATNAIKYGAWSDEGGRVRVSWEAAPSEAGDGMGRSVTLRWREEAEGVTEPKEAGWSGFGSVLLRSSAMQLGGEARQDWHERGLDTELRFVLDAS